KPKKKTRAQIDDLILTHRENGRKLARSMLRRWRVMMPAEEVDSIVDLSLCEAAGRYCESKGASFVTFFFYHLRGHLVRAVASATSDSNMFLALANGAGVDTTDWATTGSADMWALVPEIAENLRKEAESPEAMLLRKEKAGICADACNRLDELEREVIERSYLQDEPLIDIASSLGYSRCHISRVKKRALDRLKDHIFENSLTEVLDFNTDGSAEDEAGEKRAVRRRRRRKMSQTHDEPIRVAA
ncbi:MAG: sigma-70 family RNA polymerase sigma factor, partial [Deltaproteobacteria bacterium]|nr:sigma-70 family RNA polymerase sigma factor [Deltaproteobacteria bacterium]